MARKSVIAFLGVLVVLGLLGVALAQEGQPPAPPAGAPAPQPAVPAPQPGAPGMMPGMPPGMQMGMPGPGMRGCPMCPVMMRVKMRPSAEALLAHGPVLQLSEEQVAKLKEINANEQLKRVDLKAAVEKSSIKLSQLLDSEDVSLDKVKDELGNLQKAMNELLIAELKASTEAMKVLTAEQKEKAKSLRAPMPMGPGPVPPGARPSILPGGQQPPGEVPPPPGAPPQPPAGEGAPPSILPGGQQPPPAE